MRVSLIQRPIEWLSAPSNRSDAERWIAKCEGAQFVVLSEMFTTGFCVDPALLAESDCETLQWMKQMAERYGCAIAGGVAVEDVTESGERSFYNRLYVVNRDGSHTKYDKRHLFSFADEQLKYRAGGRRVVVEIEGVRVLLLVCYDLRFPVWSRNCGDYDMIICVANWPASRRSAWDILLRARAVENLCYVCGVNIVGEDPSCSYSGGTVAVDYKGNVIAAVEDNESGIATFEIDLEALNRFRERFPALNDADKFEIK